MEEVLLDNSGSAIEQPSGAAVVGSNIITSNNNSITLSDGRIAVCREAIGKDQIDARKLINGNADMFYYALFELCILVDGQKLFVSDYETMRLKDVSALTILFDKINF